MTAAPGWPALMAYGSLRMPLALLELPLFVVLPVFYGRELGVPLALVGSVLFAARLLDALADPMIGLAIDRSRARARFRRWIHVGLPLLLLGFIAMLRPPAGLTPGELALWLALSSVLTYLAWSMVSIAHQAWGAGIGADDRTRVRVTGVREACGLAGVLVSALMLEPDRIGLLLSVFAAMLGAAALAICWAPTASVGSGSGRSEAAGSNKGQGEGKGEGIGRAVIAPATGGAPWRLIAADRRFRRLLAVFVLNGTASALPATLVLFFVSDVLLAADRASAFLFLYFLAAALGMPAWVTLGGRFGPRRAWLGGMICALLAFVWAFTLGPGDVLAFGAICVMTGLALGADLAMPGALLAGVIAAAGAGGTREAGYFGVWSLATKLNLALAAGLGLPLLGYLGYRPGEPSQSTFALTLSYAALPCLIKLIAACLLWRMARDGAHPQAGAHA